MNPGQRVKEIDKLYYEDGCHDCGKFNNSASIKFSADVLSSYLKKIYDGFDVSNEIEQTAWREVLRIINEATVKGLSKSKDTHDTAFLNAIKHSNEVFSAFKVHVMSVDMSSKLIDENGHLKSFKQWLNDVSGLSSHHVGSWLNTEYNTAILRANFAADWKGFERNKDVMPNLRWMPTTSPEPDAMHAKYWLGKLTLPVNDPFWNQHHPGDRWNCKCSLESTSDPVNSSASDNPIISQKGLENNPGKDGHTFSDNHPYFPQNCASCTFYKPKLKDRFNSIFSDKIKNCYNCPYIDGCINKNNTAKLFNKYENGGELWAYPQIDKKKNDYKAIRTICKSFAERGNIVQITPAVHCKSEEYKSIYHNLIGTKYEGKCPDFSVNGIFYEYEGFVKPWGKRKVGRMLSHGMIQSNYLVIDNTRGCSDRFIRKTIIARINKSVNAFKEIWLYENGKIRLLFKDKKFY